MIVKFLEFTQNELKLTLNTKQELVARLLFGEPRFIEFIQAGPGAGLSTLFDAIEAFVHNDPHYLTRQQTLNKIEELDQEKKKLFKRIEELETEKDDLEEDVAGTGKKKK
jgi:hypothetical protein